MTTCPRCHQDHGRNALRTWLATPSWPATCQHCEIRFYPARTRTAIVSELALGPACVVALAGAPHPIAAGLLVLGAVVACLAVRAFVPLVLAPHRVGS